MIISGSSFLSTPFALRSQKNDGDVLVFSLRKTGPKISNSISNNGEKTPQNAVLFSRSGLWVSRFSDCFSRFFSNGVRWSAVCTALTHWNALFYPRQISFDCTKQIFCFINLLPGLFLRCNIEIVIITCITYCTRPCDDIWIFLLNNACFDIVFLEILYHSGMSLKVFSIKGKHCSHSRKHSIICSVIRALISLCIEQGRAEIGRASCGKECRSRWSPYH